MNIDHNDVNYYRPNELSPILVNPDGDTPKKTEAEDRTIPPLKWSVEAGVGHDTTFSKSALCNDNKIGDRNQPAVYVHLQSDTELEPGEVLSLTISGLHVHGKKREERTGRLLVQHDANDQDWPQTAAQGRVALPLSADPEKTRVEYPVNSGADMLKPLPQTSLLTYSLKGEGGKPITAGVKNNLEFVATNPEPPGGKSAWVAYLAVLAKAGDGQESICREKDLNAIKPVPAKGFRTNTKAEVERAAKSEREKGWRLVAQFESYIRSRVYPYAELKPGESLSFKLKDVMVSPTSGEAPLLVFEYALRDGRTKVNYKGSPSRNEAGRFTKLGAGFFFDYLSTDQPEIEKGHRGRLIWSAENVKKYVVHAEETLTIEPGEHAKDTKELSEATAYLLEAFSQEDLSFTRQTVAAVHDPSSTFHNVTVKQDLGLHQTAYTKPVTIVYTSNDKGDATVLKPAPVDGHEGDRFVVVGIGNVKLYTPETGRNPGLDLFLLPGGTTSVGTLYADPRAQRAVGLRVPATTTLVARPNKDVGQKSTLEVEIVAAVTTPRILPPPKK
ncbi:hypothetical protein OG413_25205 [Streptomyces sp. NBC_01433]|uniref:hypothetical protein n=1 Tax=Streptomyces sp. NBC_01433 TaxID=2903864 RepID=UPI002258F46E|nr:hypothetical protein [Streptomyces sp. NBC_01433]MCX4678565.1 hypothetical protein [Streptomyces sp. NBC_01433]